MRSLMLLLILPALLLSACTETQFATDVGKRLTTSSSEGNFKIGKPYRVEGQWYQPQEDYELVETGIASWYGPGFDGKHTANGEIFDENELTAAHRTLQLPSLVRVTNLDNGRSVVVRVNDRGPFKRGRIMDVSKKAAQLLGFANIGTAKVRLEVMTRESMEIAMAAKRGEDTRGREISYNTQGRGEVPRPVLTEATYTPGTASVATAAPGHTNHGVFYPDPVVSQEPVQPTTIFVQVGAFSVQDNAQNMAQKLQAFGAAHVYPAMVAGRQFYRVRIPAATVDEADMILARIASSGNGDAIIVVD